MTAKGRGLERECNDRREQVNAPIPRFQRLTGPRTDPRCASVTAASAAPPAAAADFVMSARDNPTSASLPPALAFSDSPLPRPVLVQTRCRLQSFEGGVVELGNLLFGCCFFGH